MFAARKYASLAAGAGMLLFLCACKSNYSEKKITSGPAPLLHATTRIYVAIPFDATFKKQVAAGSGKETAQALYAAFGRYTQSLYIGKFPESPADALETARKYNADYLAYPNLVTWEDRATEWSGRRDKLNVKIDLIDCSNGNTAFSREVAATGKWMTDGGDRPSDLLPQPCEEFVNALHRHVEKPSALW
jgi:hypothetical protein